MRIYRVENIRLHTLYDVQNFDSEREAKKYVKHLIDYYKSLGEYVKDGYSEMYSITYLMSNKDEIKYISKEVCNDD